MPPPPVHNYPEYSPRGRPCTRWRPARRAESMGGGALLGVSDTGQHLEQPAVLVGRQLRGDARYRRAEGYLQLIEVLLCPRRHERAVEGRASAHRGMTVYT